MHVWYNSSYMHYISWSDFAYTVDIRIFLYLTLHTGSA